MAYSQVYLAPGGWNSVVKNTPSGNTYAPDANNFITVTDARDINAVISLGFTAKYFRDNYAAVTDPSAAMDNTQDYGVGSNWVNTLTGRLWRCVSAGTGVAVWLADNSNIIGQLLGANMNSTADQAIPLFIPSTAVFRVNKITFTNASISLTTAAGGVYDAAAKGGNAIVAAGQAYAGLTTAVKAIDLTLALNLREAAGTLLYFSLTTAQGAAATADCYVFGDFLAR